MNGKRGRWFALLLMNSSLWSGLAAAQEPVLAPAPSPPPAPALSVPPLPPAPLPAPNELPPPNALPPLQAVPAPLPHVPPPAFRAPLPPPRAMRRMRDYSWISIDAPEPREIKVHDIVTIIVSEKSEVNVNSRFNRQRMANLKAELKEFIRLDDDFNLAPAALNQPSIDANLQGRLQSTGQMTEKEGITYRIAATVVDVLPNGNVILEARKLIRTNADVWEYSLTGVLRSEDINRDNTALSENIANLDIERRQRGKVYDSTKRPWGVVLYDLLSPF